MTTHNKRYVLSIHYFRSDTATRHHFDDKQSVNEAMSLLEKSYMAFGFGVDWSPDGTQLAAVDPDTDRLVMLAHVQTEE